LENPVKNGFGPILASGGLVIVGGWKKEGHWPHNGTQAVAATLVLLIVASALGETKIGPIIGALAWLVFLGALYATATIYTTKG
jgi:hypothetical protein